MARARAAFLLSVLAIWIASAAVDWRYVPWGNVTAPALYCVGALEGLAALAVFAASLKRTGGGLPDLFLYAITMTICASLEFVLWRYGVLDGDDKGQILRQSGAVILAPLPIVAAALLVRWTPADRAGNVMRLAFFATGSVLLGLVVLAALYMIREAPHAATGAYGQDYAMLQTMLFAVALLSTVSGLAAALAGRVRALNRSSE